MRRLTSDNTIYQIKRVDMETAENLIDEVSERKIVNALCALDFIAFNKVANDSGVSAIRLLGYIDGSERMTREDEVKMSHHLNLDHVPDSNIEMDDDVIQSYSTFKNFLEGKVG
jgi:hypothetical protein